MAKIRGEEYDVVRATEHQNGLIQEILDLSEAIKSFCEKKDSLIQQLHAAQQERPLAAQVFVNGDEGDRGQKWMTFAVGKSDGHYVVYRQLDWIHKAATTKKDKAFLEIEEE